MESNGMPESNRIHLGDCMEIMRSWPDNCVDAIVSDPPYELGFMGKSWDNTGIAYSVPMWSEALRVLKPGGHLVAFSATRTYHRMACAIEDSGFEIRDMVSWLYGSGFPKSLCVSKAIDRLNGDKRPVVGKRQTGIGTGKGSTNFIGDGNRDVTSAASAASAAWAGWGTALKPAQEPVALARKPLSEKTVAANVLRWGTGALNIEAGRIASDDDCARKPSIVRDDSPAGFGKGAAMGRWPANIILDQYAAGMMCAQEPGASRFFYVAKPSGAERDMGMCDEAMVSGGEATGRKEGSAGLNSPRAGAGAGGKNKNFHPTVKPVDVMSYLIQLVTPPGGIVLDPFMGSGTTAIAAARLSHPYIGCEMSAEYIALAEKRIAAETTQEKLL